jgi:hypothetical protein
LGKRFSVSQTKKKNNRAGAHYHYHGGVHFGRKNSDTESWKERRLRRKTKSRVYSTSTKKILAEILHGTTNTRLPNLEKHSENPTKNDGGKVPQARETGKGKL